MAFADSQATEAELVGAGPDLDGIGAPGDSQREVAERQQQALRLQQDVRVPPPPHVPAQGVRSSGHVFVLVYSSSSAFDGLI